MSEEGTICNTFVQRFMKLENRASIVNPDIHGAPDAEMKAYLKYLRSKGLSNLKSENDSTMSEEGTICNTFVQRFMKLENRASIVNPDIHGAPDAEMKAYLKYLSSET